MTFKELLDRVSRIQYHEMRSQSETFIEVVVAKAHLQELTDALISYFGPALKPQGKAASRDSDKYSKPYGGVRKDQELYYKKDENTAALALLWPWGSGAFVTVKIIRE